MCDTLTNLLRKKEWVSCLVLICFTFLCIRSSALPARSLPVVSGKPHKAITYSGAQLNLDIYSGAQLGLDTCSGAQLSLDTRDRSNFNNSTVHYTMSTPNATATNTGGRPRPTISSFRSLLLTPSDFNSTSTAFSNAPFWVNSTTTASIPINQDRSESNHVVGSTNNNVLSLPKFFGDDCQPWFSTIELIFRLSYKVLRSKMLNYKVFLSLYTCRSCRQSKLSWLRQVLNHMIQSNLC